MFNWILKSMGALSSSIMLLILGPLAFAQPQPGPIPEADLRAMLPFGNDATLKYTQCQTRSSSNCTYIWGTPDSSDAVRLKPGGKPEGDKLMTVVAQARSPHDFDRVKATYTDAEPVAGLGVNAVWSGNREQLSLITADNQVIHVHLEVADVVDAKATAIQVATFLLRVK